MQDDCTICAASKVRANAPTVLPKVRVEGVAVLVGGKVVTSRGSDTAMDFAGLLGSNLEIMHNNTWYQELTSAVHKMSGLETSPS